MEMIVMQVRQVDPPHIGQVLAQGRIRELGKTLPTACVCFANPGVTDNAFPLRTDSNERVAKVRYFHYLSHSNQATQSAHQVVTIPLQ